LFWFFWTKETTKRRDEEKKKKKKIKEKKRRRNEEKSEIRVRRRRRKRREDVRENFLFSSLRPLLFNQSLFQSKTVPKKIFRIIGSLSIAWESAGVYVGSN